MQTEAGQAEKTQSDADDATGRSGKCGTGQPKGSTSTQHSKQRWKPARCEMCGEPLEEWEARRCEGCGIEMQRLLNMDKQTAEVFFWMAEFISDRSQWFTLCKYLEGRGISPDQIAKAYNKAAESSGHSARLTPQDCE